MLVAISALLFMIILVACSNNETNNGNEAIEEIDTVTFNATIIEIHDEPNDDWYFPGRNMTVLVTSEEFGRMVFDHRRLENINATVGDVVELMITGDWEQPDPQPVAPDSWRRVD